MTTESTQSDFVSPEWDKAALLVVDVQAEFVDGSMPVPGTADRLPELARLVAAFRRAGRPIVHVVRLYVPGGSDTDLPRRAEILNGKHVVAPGSDGSQIPAVLLPTGVRLDPDLLLAGKLQELTPTEHILFKPRWSSFYRTTLEEHLRAQDISTVVVAGCNLPNCPRATLFDASERDFRAVVVADATSQATPERLHDLTLIGVSIATTAEAEDRLGSA